MRLEDIRIRDPFLFRDGDVIYLYGTTDKNTWSGKGEGFDYYITEDMRSFRGPFPAFRPGMEFWADENFWAPEVWKWKGMYYMIASCRREGLCRGVQIFWTNDLKVPFIPLENHAVTPSDWECLDGTLYIRNEKVYLVFSHEWLQSGDGEICAVELKEDLTEMKGSPAVLFRASEADWTVLHEEFGREGFVTDGPFLFEEDGILNMIWSSYSKTGYAMGLSQSEDGIWGKWMHQKAPLYAGNGGHGMLFEDKGQKWIVLHSPNELYKERVHFLRWK